MSIRGSRRRRAGLPLPPRDGEVVDIVEMRRRDIASVVAIEREIFAEPWSQGLYLSELAQRATRRYYAATSGGNVVGYAGGILVAGEAHVTTIGVARSWQKRKIGARLMYRFVADAREWGAGSITLEVRMSNTFAQRLYEWFGFAPVGVRKNYYVATGEDGLVMHIADADSEEYGERLRAIGRALGEVVEEQTTS
ncbi:MAG: ribosomal protein S18-alanine N-acetyltransferase [Acidimicrobiales bacterium]